MQARPSSGARLGDGPQQARSALVAGHVTRVHHACDRRVHAAVRAFRAQLEAAQAGGAAEAAGQVGGAQPRLAAARAGGAEVDRFLTAHAARSRRAMKKPSVLSTSGSVWRRLVSVNAGWRSRKRSTCSGPSAGETVQTE